MSCLHQSSPLEECINLLEVKFLPIRRRCQPSGAAGVRCLAHGHLDTWSDGTVDWTTNLPVCRQPTWSTAAPYFLL